MSAKAPAVFVAVLGFNDLQVVSGSYEAAVSWGAFVVAKDKHGQPRDLVAASVVDLLALIIPDNNWELPETIGTPVGVRGDNLFSAAVDKIGVAMWAVTWRQRMQIGQVMTNSDLAALDIFKTFDAKFPVKADAPVAEDQVSLPQDGN